jgi:hypothetical protein
MIILLGEWNGREGAGAPEMGDRRRKMGGDWAHAEARRGRRRRGLDEGFFGQDFRMDGIYRMGERLAERRGTTNFTKDTNLGRSVLW